jgi:dextranase
MDHEIRLLPSRAVFADSESASVEIRDATGRVEVTVLHWGEPIKRFDASAPGIVDLGLLPAGGYGVEVRVGEHVARTAVDIAKDPASRCRYGFVVDFKPDRDPAPIADNLRQLHLTDVLFYDWAYRHADLLGGGETYADPLGQPVSLHTVRRLIRACHEVGSQALGYAAVYAVGNDEWPDWQKIAMLTASGVPYGLGDFLSVIDPADAEWLAHFTNDLVAGVRQVGFDGYHLDQYDAKRGLRADGSVVDLAESFATLIAEVRAALPSSRLVFNNVNNFPVWRTARSPLNVVYIEVWPPHTTLGHLARLAREALREGGGKPVAIAAYQHVYDTAPTRAADLATAFTMATLFSHGATHLLCGESDRLLVDPYYVRNHVVETSTAAMLRRWYDFCVEHIELLQHPEAVDVTGCLAGDYNGDCDVSCDGIVVADQPTASTVWRRIVGVDDHRLVMHLINLVGQDDTAWDSARKEPIPVSGATLRARRLGKNQPRVRFADPDRQPHLTDVPVTIDGDYVVAELPPLGVWQLLVIDL